MGNELAKQSDSVFVVRRGDVFFDKEGRTVIDDKEASSFLKEYLADEENRFVSIGDASSVADTNYVLCGGNGYCPQTAAAIDDIAANPR